MLGQENIWRDPELWVELAAVCAVLIVIWFLIAGSKALSRANKGQQRPGAARKTSPLMPPDDAFKNIHE